MNGSDVRSFVSSGCVAILVALIVLLTAGESRTAEAQGNGLNRPREVWVAIRDDGKPGTGTVTDSFDGGSVEKLNALFEKFRKEYGENLTIHFGPGMYYGEDRWQVLDNWKIRGAGMDITVFKTTPNPDSIDTVGFSGQAIGVEISDLTVDFNVLALRKANRVFTWPQGETWRAGTNINGHQLNYFFAKDLPAWKAGTGYKRGQAVRHKETEYMCVAKWGVNCTEEPETGEGWNVLRSNHPEELSAWKAGQNYTIGEAVSAGGSGYVCLSANPSNPTADGAGWEAVNPEEIDPMIDPHAVAIGSRVVDMKYQSGHSRVSRVRALNGNGSRFFDREGFIIWVAGSDGVIEDCVVEQFRGDYSTQIVLSCGRNSVVRGCTVKSNGSGFGYGGWGCFDAVFENNYGENLSYATNIDSLNNRNVTFRNNVFVNIGFTGIQVNAPTGLYTGPDQYNWIDLDGRKVFLKEGEIDGLYIYDNYVEMCDSMPTPGGAAIWARGEGLRNVVIRGNTLRTKSGQGRRGAIMVSGQNTNATVYDNICEPNMHCEIIPPAVIGVWHNNVDLLGQPMKDRQGKPVAVEKPANPGSNAGTAPSTQPGAQMGNITPGRILFLGNSITLHPPKPDIGWFNNWGMAASALEKDYVHLLVKSISEITGKRPEVLIETIVGFEVHYDTDDIDSRLKKDLEFKADLVVVAIGENVPSLVSDESKTKFKASMVRLLTALKKNNNPTILVRSCFWPDKTKDEIMEQACSEVGGIYVDISGLYKDKSNQANTEREFANSGVGSHPGDKGMEAIAGALLDAREKTR